MVLAFAQARKHRDHLTPVLELLPDVSDDIALVAGFYDLLRAQRVRERIVLMQHGAGQSYTEPWPAYPGGDRNDAVGLFLCPNEHSAERWRRRYPSADVEVVGSPRLDDLPLRGPGPRPVIAFSFHFDARFCPEARSAFHRYSSALPRARALGRILGHGHPARTGLRGYYRRNGIEYVETFDEVCRRADVYVCDNSSTLFEFAATGRPVVVLNDPRYRRSVSHGLRFWEAAGVGVQVNEPAELLPAIERALELRAEDVDRREQALSLVYAVRRGGTDLAAAAIRAWA